MRTCSRVVIVEWCLGFAFSSYIIHCACLIGTGESEIVMYNICTVKLVHVYIKTTFREPTKCGPQ